MLSPGKLLFTIAGVYYACIRHKHMQDCTECNRSGTLCCTLLAAPGSSHVMRLQLLHCLYAGIVYSRLVEGSSTVSMLVSLSYLNVLNRSQPK